MGKTIKRTDLVLTDYFKISFVKRDQKDGLWSVAIRYYSPEDGENYHFTKEKITTKEFEKDSPRFKQCMGILADLTHTALEIAGVNIGPDREMTNCEEMNWEKFKAGLLGKKVINEKRSLIALINRYVAWKAARPLVIDQLAFGTKRMYEVSTNRILHRIKLGIPLGVEYNTDLDLTKLKLEPQDITAANFNSKKKLELLTSWMYKHATKGLCDTTVSMYMRCVCAAIKQGVEGYPVINEDGKEDDEKKDIWVMSDGTVHKYVKPKSAVGTIPVEVEDYERIRNFNVSDIKKKNKHCGDLHHAKKLKTLQYAKDFWCMMVLAGGMEAKSIAKLRWSTVNGKKFKFQRDKIIKKQPIWTTVMIDDDIKTVFDKYANKATKASGGYVFSVLKEDMSEEKYEVALRDFHRKISKNMRLIGEYLELDPIPNCKNTRPSFAVMVIENGGTMEDVATGLSHTDLGTSQIYVKNVSDKHKLAASERNQNILKKIRQKQNEQQNIV